MLSKYTLSKLFRSRFLQNKCNSSRPKKLSDTSLNSAYLKNFELYQSLHETAKSQINTLGDKLKDIDLNNTGKVKVEIEGKIGIILFESENFKVNVFNLDLVNKLTDSLDLLNKNPEIDIIAFKSAKSNSFSAGADLNLLAYISNDQQLAYDVCTAFQNFIKLILGSKPTVAIIEGDCLGAGLELALACSYCVGVNKNSKFGFPESRLGLIPGGLGFYLAYKYTPVAYLMKFVLIGSLINHKEAIKRGIITNNACFAENNAWNMEGLLSLAHVYNSKKGFFGQTRADSLYDDTFLNKIFKFPIIIKTYKNLWNYFKYMLLYLQKYYYLPLKYSEERDYYLNVDEKLEIPFMFYQKEKLSPHNILETYCKYEAEVFSRSLCQTITRNALNIQTKKNELKFSRPVNLTHGVKNFGIIGHCGNIGSQISTLILKHKPERLVLFDKDVESTDEFRQNLYLKMNYDKYGLPTTRFINIENVHHSTGFEDFKDVEFVFESVSEDINVKKSIINAIHEINSDCIIGSTTSALRVEDISRDSKMKENCIGVHFLSPLDKINIVEIVPSQYTSKVVLQKTISIMESLGKTPIVIKDSHGFFTTRVLMAICDEIFQLYALGSSPFHIDNQLKYFGFKYSFGKVIDRIGIDVIYNIYLHLSGVFDNQFHENPYGITFLKYLYDHGAYGVKSGEGIYSYDMDNKPLRFNIPGKIFHHFQSENMDTYCFPFVNFDNFPTFVVLRILNECCRCLEEGVIKSPFDGDMAAIYGFGFPVSLGGPFRYIDFLTPKYVAGILFSLYDSTDNRVFEPCQLLKELVSSNKKIYEN